MGTENLKFENQVIEKLRKELKIFKFDLVTQYRIPGTDYIADLYIPFIPPVLIDIKIFNQNFNYKIVRSFADNIFKSIKSDAIIFFIVIVKNVEMLETINFDNIHVIKIGLDGNYINQKDIAAAAENISVILKNFRSERSKKAIENNLIHDTSRFAFDDNSIKSDESSISKSLISGVSALSNAFSRTKSYVDQIGIINQICCFWKNNYKELKQIDFEQKYDNQNKENTAYNNKESMIYNVFKQINVLKTICSQFVTDKCYKTIEMELDSFSDEYKLEHFTACALRVGRLLESIVYNVAIDWSVSVENITIEKLEKLDNIFKQIKNDVLKLKDEYSNNNNSNEISKLKNLIFDNSGKFQIHMMEMVSEFEQPNSVSIKSAEPKYIQSILSDIKKKYAKKCGKIIADKLYEINSLTDVILEIRNRAAHADKSGNPREINEEEVNKMIEKVEKLIYLLMEVGNQIVSESHN